MPRDSVEHWLALDTFRREHGVDLEALFGEDVFVAFEYGRLRIGVTVAGMSRFQASVATVMGPAALADLDQLLAAFGERESDQRVRD